MVIRPAPPFPDTVLMTLPPVISGHIMLGPTGDTASSYSLQLEEDLGLPTHLPSPRITSEKAEN